MMWLDHDGPFVTGQPTVLRTSESCTNGHQRWCSHFPSMNSIGEEAVEVSTGIRNTIGYDLDLCERDENLIKGR